MSTTTYGIAYSTTVLECESLEAARAAALDAVRDGHGPVDVVELEGSGPALDSDGEEIAETHAPRRTVETVDAAAVQAPEGVEDWQAGDTLELLYRTDGGQWFPCGDEEIVSSLAEGRRSLAELIRVCPEYDTAAVVHVGRRTRAVDGREVVHYRPLVTVDDVLTDDAADDAAALRDVEAGEVVTLSGGEYHVTRRTGRGVYGHRVASCDESGCAGSERYLGEAAAPECCYTDCTAPATTTDADGDEVCARHALRTWTVYTGNRSYWQQHRVRAATEARAVELAEQAANAPEVHEEEARECGSETSAGTYRVYRVEESDAVDEGPEGARHIDSGSNG